MKEAMVAIDVMVETEAAELLRKEAAKTGKTEAEVLNEIVMRELPPPVDPGQTEPEESAELNRRMGLLISDLIIRALRKQ